MMSEFPMRTSSLLVAGVLLVCVSCSWKTDGDHTAPPTIVKAVAGRPGLSPAERDTFYHLEEGSEVFPVSWFLALESEDGNGLFAENLERFGLIPNRQGPTNPLGLPVGLTAAPTRDLKQFGVQMLGVNCAACHVAELTYNGNRLRLDGAPSRFNTSAFYGALATATLRTIDIRDGPDRLIAFIRRRKAGENPALSADEAARSARLQPALAGLERDPAAAFDQAFKDQLTGVLNAEATNETLDLNKDVVLRADSPAFPEATERFSADLTKGLADPRVMGIVPPASAASPEMREAGGVSELRSSILPSFIKDAVTTFRLLKARASFLLSLNEANSSKNLVPGYGRVDAFGGARNLVWRDNAQPLTGPVSYPDLWAFDSLAWVHWDGNTTSVLERNIGQALGLGAVLDRATKISTVSVVNLHTLEVLARKIAPPRWDDSILGAVDSSRAAAGKPLFDEHCASCHVQQVGKEFTLKDLGGVDANRAANFTVPVGNRPNAEVIAELLRDVKLKAFEEKKLTPEQREVMERGRPARWRSHNMYVARPLVGIWASAPYLHNNSVPTLYDLLLPAAQRPSVFFTGDSEYDPVNIGIRTTNDGSRRFKFDTALSGNRNTGHEFGTALNDDQRRSLLEYLKTF
jgi:mono/diheme cytochrome c family protein